MPSLITDLALILIVAGIVTILFKRLKQPLVLGYIVAGFLVGPNMTYMPTITDAATVKVWSDIGVIFLMFSLGLEFSFKKILKMGSAPVIAATAVMLCMFGVGNGVGRLFGWAEMDCMFLGGMLAMSSTTIIYKALDDLGMRSKKFAGEVLSVLILEDILGILLMVLLSAMAVSREFQGGELVASMLKLAFFLILWFIVGIFIVPLVLRRAQKWITNEMLLIVSIGLCFLMVMLAEQAGYSEAFGAFMMGSILAETIEAEKIEKVVTPLRDLFGAIFFVSVGMMVEPAVLGEYWLPILCLVIAVVVGQAIFGTTSFLISGQSLKISMQCGFSLAQIGEFAFIIASLGVSLGVTGKFLYPVVVAVSIITTFFTPYMIKAAEPAYGFFERVLPDKVISRFSERDSRKTGGQAGDGTEGNVRSHWRAHLINVAVQVAIYAVLCFAAIGIGLNALLPICRNTFTHWPGNAICGLTIFFVVAPFLRAIVMRSTKTPHTRFIHRQKGIHPWLLLLLFIARSALAVYFIYYIINYLSPYASWLHVLIAIALLVGIVISRRVKLMSIRLERTFINNLRMRDFKSAQARPAYARRLYAHDVYTVVMEVPQNSKWAGKTLRDLNFSRVDGVMIAAIVRGNTKQNVPDADAMIFPGDRLTVISDDSGIQRFKERLEAEVTEQSGTSSSVQMIYGRLNIKERPEFIGKTVGESGIREKFQCLIVGFLTPNGSLDIPFAGRVMQPTDTIWLVGEPKDLKALGAKR